MHVRRHTDDAEPLNVVAKPESHTAIDRVGSWPQAFGEPLIDQRDVGVRVLRLLAGEVTAKDDGQVDRVEEPRGDTDRLDVDLIGFIGLPVDHQPAVRAAIVSRNTRRDRRGGDARQC